MPANLERQERSHTKLTVREPSISLSHYDNILAHQVRRLTIKGFSLGVRPFGDPSASVRG